MQATTSSHPAAAIDRPHFFPPSALMPPRINQGQSSFSVSQESQQVVCPLKNQDGTNCRKRCLGEKRYRSMQEHIRRAHPEHYIPKLPATEESFRLMIETPPQAKPPQLPAGQSTTSSSESAQAANGIPTITTQSFGPSQDPNMMQFSQTGPARTLEDQHPMAATAAVALAQLHNQRAGSEWSQDRISHQAAGNGHAIDRSQGFGNDYDKRPHSSYELPPINDPQRFPTSQPRGLLPSMLDHSPPGRSTTLPPIQQDGTRPRNRSIGEQARVTKHLRKPSKSSYARRMSLEGRKAYSVKPPGSDAFLAKTKRWEELIEAATSIRDDESDRDLTPIPGTPLQRSSVPPLHVPSSVQRADVYKASPLGRALTPPHGIDQASASSSSNVPFPSIESSVNSYPSHAHSHSHSQSSFPMPSTAGSYPSDSSPQFHARSLVEIYCSNCHRPNPLKDSFACVECIGGFCIDCVYTLSGTAPGSDGRGVRAIGGRAREPCPKCRGEGGVYKPFQVELRV